MKTTILVVGANGQVGRELPFAISLLLSRAGIDHHVCAFDRGDLDISNLPLIYERLSQIAPDFIVNAAAYTAVDKAESEPEDAFIVNDLAVREMANYCRSSACTLIHLSTDYIFDGRKHEPYSEEDYVGPASVYGRSKLAGEEGVREILPAHIILRTSWVFGVCGGNFVKTMLRLSSSKSNIGVVDDQCGGPTAARSIANTVAVIIRKLVLSPRATLWGTYHYSGYPYVSWADFAVEIFAMATAAGVINHPPKIHRVSTLEYPTPAIRPANSRLDCSKLKKNFGIEPDDWRQSLAYVLDKLREGGQN